MPTAPMRRIYTPYAPGIQPTWSVSQVRGALTSHELGNFDTSARLAEAMGRDDRLSAVLETRVKGLLGLPFRLDATDQDDEQAKRIAEELDRDWFDMIPEDELAELLRWRILMGFAVASLEWTTEANKWRPRVKVWNPQYLYYEEDSDTWYLFTKEGQIEINPGDGKWLMLGRGRRPYMYGAIRNVAIPWLVRQFAIRDWARYSERHGLPIVKAMVPAAIEAGEKTEFFEDVRALSTETTVTLPTHVTPDGAGFDLELLEAKDRSWEGFERLITSCNVSLSVAILGQNLTTEVQGGSYAAARVHDRVRADYLQSDAEETSTILRRELLDPVVSYSYQGAEGKTPWPKWQTEPAEDTRVEAETLKITAEALGQLKQAGFSIASVEDMSHKLGLELVPSGPPPVAGGELNRQGEVTLASGDRPSNAEGMIGGQLFVDDMAEAGAVKGTRALAPDLRKVLSIIDDAEDYPELRARLREAYGDMKPDAFARLVEKALILSELAGRYSVTVDL